MDEMFPRNVYGSCDHGVKLNLGNFEGLLQPEKFIDSVGRGKRYAICS